MIAESRQNPIDLPAFYRIQCVGYRGRNQLVTIKNEHIADVQDAAHDQIETLAHAHNEVRHWTMIHRESLADTTFGGIAFAEFAAGKLEAARSELKRALAAVDEGAK